jgi:hypothetical protein
MDAGLTLVPIGVGGLPAAPRKIRAEQAKADAIIQYAAKVKDWPLLEQAIDLKIEQQREFVRWWDEAVHRKGGERWLDVSDTEISISADRADELTGIDKVQVSRWRQRLCIKQDKRWRKLSISQPQNIVW